MATDTIRNLITTLTGQDGLARRLIEQHGGRIWAESSSAKTTTFCFTLFLADQEQPIPAFEGNIDPLMLSARNGSVKEKIMELSM